MSEIECRSIDIDFEIYQLIVLEKRGFHESDNAALRRLLGLNHRHPDQRKGDGVSWSRQDVVLPAGTRLRMVYGGIEHNGVVVGGKWKIDEGECYDTPSQAASTVAQTKHGGKTQLNGWKYWYIKRPSDTNWILLDKLRNLN